MRRTATGALLALLAAGVIVTPPDGAVDAADKDAATYHSPFDAAYSPDGKLLAVTDHTAAAVALISPATGKVVRRVKLSGAPAGAAWSPGGDRLFVAEQGAGTVAQIDPAGKVTRRFRVDPYPSAVAVSPP